MSKPTELVDFYALLGVPPLAQESEIRTAIRNQRKDWTRRQNHPDAELRSKAEKTVSLLSQAEPLLLDVQRRVAYDAQLKAQQTAAEALARQAEQDARRAVRPPAGRDWLEVARQHLSAGKAFEANYAAREATNQNSENAEAWFVRARSSLGLKHSADAQFEASEALRLNPSKPANHALLGDIYGESGNLATALIEYNEAARLDPNEPAFAVAAAGILGKIGRRPEAISVLERVAVNHPDVPYFQEQYADLLLSDAVDKWSTDLSGNKVITNPAQVGATLPVLNRIHTLAGTNPDLSARIARVERLCSDSMVMKWYPTANRRWYLGVFIVSVLVMMSLFSQGGTSVGGGFLFLLVAIGVALVYVKRHHLPQWKVNKKAYPSTVTSSGIQ